MEQPIHVIIEHSSWISEIGDLGPIAILISAFIAALIANNSIKTNRAIARKRATIDVILKLESEPNYQKSMATFKDFRDSGKLLDLINNLKSQKDKEALLEITTFINHYELICTGMMEDTLDELFYFKWYRGALLKHWADLCPFILKLREIENNNQLWIRFQTFAECWKNDEFVTISKDRPSNHLNNQKTVKYKQD